MIGFVLKYWKYLAVIALLAGAFFWYKGQLKQAYEDGKADCNAEWIKRIDAENQKNRKFEQEVKTELDKFGQKFEKQQKERVVKETTHKETIREILKDDPKAKECKVEPRVIEERNKIRRLGPQGPSA